MLVGFSIPWSWIDWNNTEPKPIWFVPYVTGTPHPHTPTGFNLLSDLIAKLSQIYLPLSTLF